MWLSLLLTAYAADIDVPGDYPTISAALDVADAGDRILVAAGSYCEDINVYVDDVTIEGAGVGLTVIDGSCAVGTGVLAVHDTDTFVLRDLTIDGDATFTNLIVNEASWAIAERVAFVHGGARGSYGSGSENGGAVRLNDPESDLDCIQCVVCRNDSDGDGGGIWIDGGRVRIEQSVFVNNEAVDAGGAVYLQLGSDAEIVNSTFFDNEANFGAAVRLRELSAADITNAIFVEHGTGFAIEGALGSFLSGSHNLFWDNDGDASPAVFSDSITADPLFVAALDDCDSFDFTLSDGSPAVGAGSSDGVFDDIGAYEYVPADLDGDGFEVPEDCDDADATVNPDADEVCGGGDENCNGLVDDADPDLTDPSSWWADLDGDGVGAGAAILACEAPDGTVGVDGDCDDDETSIAPGAPESCNGVDDNCDGAVDEGLTDSDDDGVCDALDACVGTDALGDADTDGFCADEDCADDDASVSPAAQEVCGGGDEDCDGLVDDDDPGVSGQTLWYDDDDGDGFGEGERTVTACEPGDGWAMVDGDCDDAEALAYPDADEYCGTVDYDCDGLPGDEDDDAIEVTWYFDADLDGYGDAAYPFVSCEVLVGYSREPGDCDNDDDTVFPGAEEVCGDGVDQDCDGRDARCDDTGGAGSTGDTGATRAGRTGDTGGVGGSGATGGTTGPGTDPEPSRTDTGGPGSDPLPTSPTDKASDDEGLAPACGCQSTSPQPAFVLGVLSLLGVRRRRI